MKPAFDSACGQARAIINDEAANSTSSDQLREVREAIPDGVEFGDLGLGDESRLQAPRHVHAMTGSIVSRLVLHIRPERGTCLSEVLVKLGVEWPESEDDLEDEWSDSESNYSGSDDEGVDVEQAAQRAQGGYQAAGAFEGASKESDTDDMLPAASAVPVAVSTGPQKPSPQPAVSLDPVASSTEVKTRPGPGGKRRNSTASRPPRRMSAVDRSSTYAYGPGSSPQRAR